MYQSSEERLEQFSYPDGSSMTVKYVGELLSAIRIQEGCWMKEGNVWAFYDNRRIKLDVLDGEMRVSGDGDIIAERKDGYCEIQYTDGTFQIRYPSGKVETHYAKPAKVTVKPVPSMPAAAPAKPAAPVEPKMPASSFSKNAQVSGNPAAPAQVKAAAAPIPVPVKAAAPIKRAELKTQDFRKQVNDKRLAELNGWQAKESQWQAVEKTNDARWYVNSQGDKAKQDARTGATTIYHADGSWEQVDKNGKLKIHLIA